MKVNIKGVSKTYKSKSGPVKALDNINLSTEEKEFLCILGPSGCGKTTLLRVIAGLLQPTSGEIIYEGTKKTNGPSVAMVFQELGVFPWMNVIDNVCFGLEMQKLPKQERYALALPLINKLGLRDFTRHYPHNLSLGMKQRVGLARALVSQAEILLMDEPFAALDAQMRRISQEKLLEVCREYDKSVIYVTHDIDEALFLADRIILLTSRPATIKGEIKVSLPRPRDFSGAGSAEFLQMKSDIWQHIRGEVEKSIAVQ